MAIIEVKGLKKSFGPVQALAGVDLTVEEGQIMGFIGPNGAGKSTLIRILLGLLRKDEGSCQVFGLDAYQEAVEIHKRISYVPGDVSLWPNLTGGEVIDLLTDMQDKKVDQKKKNALMEQFDFDPTKKARTYSKGNRQKVALIAAFCVESDLYILDEPTSGLDPLMERVFQSLILEHKKKGKTVLLSSHILSEVEKLCDQVAIIRKGEIIESGSLKDLRHLTRMQFSVEVETDLSELKELAGVHEVIKEGGKYLFQVDQAQLSSVLEYLSRQKIDKLESLEPKLEDLFMRHYEQKEEVNES